MPYWPRTKLTKEEKQWCRKYDEPQKPGRGVLSRIYAGSLVLSSTQRNPIFPFQISRRSRVYALTICGDVERFKLTIITSSGELHTPQPVRIPHLLPGWNQSPQGLGPAEPPIASPPVAGSYEDPYVFDPNIVLLPNQTLNINGQQTEPFDGAADIDYRIDMALHVLEFPGMPGSPL